MSTAHVRKEFFLLYIEFLQACRHDFIYFNCGRCLDSDNGTVFKLFKIQSIQIFFQTTEKKQFVFKTPLYYGRPYPI